MVSNRQQITIKLQPTRGGQGSKSVEGNNLEKDGEEKVEDRKGWTTEGVKGAKGLKPERSQIECG